MLTCLHVRACVRQWVDMHIPGVPVVGGFSICSTSSQLPCLRLAVKSAMHPPARWCHEHGEPGAAVQLRVGGAFVYDAAADNAPRRHLLLVAGGVGVNPLYAMLQDFARTLPSSPDAPSQRRATLFLSSSAPDEFPFKDEIDALCAAHPGRVAAHYNITRPQPGWTGRVGRLRQDWLLEAMQAGAPAGTVLDLEHVQAYMCGPPPMMEDMQAMLVQQLKLREEQVRFERWW